MSTWREDLRLLDELQLDELHKACARRCAEVSGLTSAGTLRPLASRGLWLEALREVELRAKAKEGLREIAAAFLSADFQVPSERLRLGDGVLGALFAGPAGEAPEILR